MRALAIALVLALVLGLAGPQVRGEDDRCYAWGGDADPIVRNERLPTARDVREQAKGHVKGDLLKITLCREHGRYVYHLVVLEGGGRITNLTVDAQRPFAR